LACFAVDDLARALEQVEALGDSVVHPGSASTVCKDSEGSPLGCRSRPAADRSRFETTTESGSYSSPISF